MLYNKLNILLLTSILHLCVIAQPLHAQNLKTYSFEEVDSLQLQEPKPLFIDIYTDWCRYCVLMDERTYADTEVIEILNDQFYFIKLNAESKDSIFFNGHTFRYIPNGIKTGTHELARALGSINNVLSYPTFTIMNKDREIIGQHNSYLTAKQLLTILKAAK